MGATKIEIDWNVLNSILQFKCSKKVCADHLGCSEDTIDRRIKEEHDCTFKEYAETKLSTTKVKLQTKAIEKALGGDNTMLIFCLKNICAWSDKQEIDHSIKSDTIAQLIEKNASSVTDVGS